MAKNDITFKEFWDAYNLKRDRQRAERAWNRLPMCDHRAAYNGIEAYQSTCRRSGISIMYAQGYLNNRRWEDEAVGSGTERELFTNPGAEPQARLRHAGTNGKSGEGQLFSEPGKEPDDTTPLQGMETW